MIVNCPNCSLEQPLDPFCAGCGKQLPKLLEEHKQKLLIRKKRTYSGMLSSVFVFIVGAYFYYAYQHPEVLNLGLSSNNKTIVLPRTKIKAEAIATKSLKSPIKIIGAATNKQASLQKFNLKSIKKNKENPKTSSFKKEIKSLTFVTVQNCATEDIESGELSEEELFSFLECSTEVFKIGSENEEIELDGDAPVLNSISLKQISSHIVLNFKLNLEEEPYTKQRKLKFLNADSTKAFAELWANPLRINDADSEQLKQEGVHKELLSSYALSSLLGLSKPKEEPLKGYFLAVYK